MVGSTASHEFESSTFALTATLAFGLFAAPASRRNCPSHHGRTLSVKGHRIDGETIVLTLRGGGEVNIDKTLVEKIVADEVPYPEPETTIEELVAGARRPSSQRRTTRSSRACRRRTASIRTWFGR